jgi:hypothetical protein
MKISLVAKSTAVPKGNVAKEVQVLPKFFFIKKMHGTVSLLKIEARIHLHNQPEKKYHFQTKYSHTIW